ncbi:MAG: efflux RND transporter periplasmic adaptor subunit, partial [Lachnospiraceae bacterium]|nr:efflux RND transporter periplasmic adaptor subunit [Lachnospiraceae bacterium]
MSKKKIGIIIGVAAAVIVIAVVAICIWLFGGKGGGNSSDKVYVEQISTIMKQTSAAGNRFSGIVEPQETLEINKDSERTVKEVMVSVGDAVEE